MAFNKVKEEKKWNLWKEREEQQLRSYGMPEDAIALLRIKDWEDFNSERRFRERNMLLPGVIESYEIELEEPEVVDTGQLMDAIEDEQLLHILMQADKETLQMVLLKMMGFSVREIAEKTGICEHTIYTKMNRLKKKIKKMKESE
jgi:DNA-directed RNA polymerase specialized sigma24 family protein